MQEQHNNTEQEFLGQRKNDQTEHVNHDTKSSGGNVHLTVQTASRQK